MTQQQGRGFGFVTGLLAKTKIEEGAFCHFRSPEDSELLYLPHDWTDMGGVLTPDPSKRVGAWVRSINSQAFQSHKDAVTRRGFAENRRAKTTAQKQELVIRQMKIEAPESFAVLVGDFENTSVDGGRWTPTHEEKLALARDLANTWLVDQVMQFSGDDSNFAPDSPEEETLPQAAAVAG